MIICVDKDGFRGQFINGLPVAIIHYAYMESPSSQIVCHFISVAWNNHGRRLVVAIFPCKGGGPVQMAYPWRLMETEEFLNVLGDLLAEIAGNTSKALVLLWNSKMKRAIDTIVSKCPVWCHGA